MSEYGLRIWDSSGLQILNGMDKTMRIAARVQVRLGGGLSGTHTVSVPAARAGMYGLVQCVTAYTPWSQYGYGCRNSVPSVRVIDGAIQLYGPSRSQWTGNVDVILVTP